MPALLAVMLTLPSVRIRAALLAYEGFDYPAGSAVVGLDGGTGFSEPYQANGSGAGSTSTIIAGSLTYTDGSGNSLITTGNRGFFAGSPTANNTAQPSRSLSFGRSNALSTTWISFIGIRQGTPTNSAVNNPYPRGANLALFNGTSERIGFGNASIAAANATASNSWSILPANTPAQLRQTAVPFTQLSLVVVRIDHLGDSAAADNAYIFINPDLTSEPNISTASTNVIGFADHSFNRIRPFAGGYNTGGGPPPGQPNAELYLDEIRIGETFADVTPHTTGAVAKTVTWEGNASTDWDSTTGNWRTNGVSGATYAEGDFARFDDTANLSSTTINLPGVIFPGSVTVSNGTLPYTFSGSGSIAGKSGLTKQGAGSLTIANTGNNSSTGLVSIAAGTLQVGDGGTAGNLGPGNITNNGTLIFNRSDNVTLGNGISGSGSLIKNGDGTLALTGANSYSGPTLVNAGSLVLSGSISGGGLLTNAPGTTVSGSGILTGPFAASGRVAPGTSAGTLTVGDLTLYTGATATFEISSTPTVGGGVNDLIQANGNLNLNNNSISLGLLGLPQTGVPYSLISYTGTRSGTLNPMVTFPSGSRFAATVGYDDAGKKVNVTLSGGPAALQWNSTAALEWDNGVTTNWFNTGTSAPDAFFPFDSVSFGDTPGLQTTVDIPAGVTVSPSSAVVNSTANAYFIGGLGGIGGTGSFTKSGGSTLSLSGVNSFVGGLIINGGMVRLTSLNAPGRGPITVNNACTLVAGGAHTNAILIAGGTMGSVTAVASFSGGLTTAAATTSIIRMTDPDSPTINSEMNFTGDLQGSGNLVVVAGDSNPTVDGGVGFRLRGTGASTFSGSITISNNVKGELQTGVTTPFSPAGTGKIVLVGGVMDGNGTVTAPAVGGFSEFNIRNNSTNHAFLGNNVEVIGSGLALLNPLGSAPTNSISTMGNLKIGGSQELGVIRNSGQPHTVAFQSVTLTGGDATFSPKTPGFGAVTVTGSDLSLSNITQQAGSGIIMSGLRTLYLTGTNGYTGNTTVNSGLLSLIGNSALTNSPVISLAAGASLSVTGRVGGTLVLVNGQTLKGNGGVVGNVQAGAGSTLTPGESVGALTLSGNVTLQGTNIMEIDKAGGTNDVIQGVATLTYGGTLVVANLNTPLGAGNSFKLFKASSYNGAFSAIQPATPGAGLLWSTTGLTNGTLKVVSATPLPRPSIASFTVSPTDVTLTGTNGPAYGTYQVLTSTNVAQPTSSWTVLSTGYCDASGNIFFTAPVDPSDSQRFYLLQLP